VRRESLDIDHPEEARNELEELAQQLREEGRDIEVAGQGEATWSRLRESAEHEFVDVLNMVVNEGERLAIDAIILTLIHWARKRRFFRGRGGAKPTAAVWEDGDIVRTVPLPVMTKWFKLIGSTEDPVKDDWEHEEPGIFTKMHFPRNKRPVKISNDELVIVYAVKSMRLIATQKVVDTKPASKERKGEAGTDEHRWPWEIIVGTDHYCSPLATAPELREVAPDFKANYASYFREGSHWEIADSEYDQLAAAITAAGRSYSPG
jgi:hypothetical protein